MNNPASAQQPLARGVIMNAGGASVSSKPWRVLSSTRNHALVLYCCKGGGWCEVAGRLHPARAGDLLVLPWGVLSACGPNASNPWAVLWAEATGDLLPGYFAALGLGEHNPVLRTGGDPQVARLFNEVIQALGKKGNPGSTLEASNGLAYLLAVLIARRQHAHGGDPGSSKVAQAIIFMSDNLDHPLRVSILARQSGLSAAYFSELFKEQTGCSPREYLHLLRIHRACQLLRDGLSIKEVAARVGYEDPFHFSRRFKAFQGISPSKYRGGSA